VLNDIFRWDFLNSCQIKKIAAKNKKTAVLYNTVFKTFVTIIVEQKIINIRRFYYVNPLNN
jgi:hypothetical protein